MRDRSDQVQYASCNASEIPLSLAELKPELNQEPGPSLVHSKATPHENLQDMV